MPFNPVLVQDIELKKFQDSPEAQNSYIDGKNKLLRSGIINLLRIFSRPFTRDNGANPHSAAYNAAFSEGYNKCLDDIVYFEEMYLTQDLGKKPIRATFGALGIALAKGDLTEKDIRNGK